MEIKNKLTVTGSGGKRGKEREGSSRNKYKGLGLMDKDNQGEGIECGRWG